MTTDWDSCVKISSDKLDALVKEICAISWCMYHPNEKMPKFEEFSVDIRCVNDEFCETIRRRRGREKNE